MTIHAAEFAVRQAEGLAYGLVRKSVCPSCNGGRTKEVSFGVGREPDRVWWKCARASCPEQGHTGGHNLPPADAARLLDRIKPYRGAFLQASQRDVMYFVNRFALHEHTVADNIGATERDEYLLPYRGPNGRLRGYIVRQPWWAGEPKPVRVGQSKYLNDYKDDYGRYVSTRIHRPKTITYPHSTSPVMSWYKAHGRADPEGFYKDQFKHLVVVEDQISAMRVAQAGIRSVALLGCGMNLEKARDIARTRPKVVTLALDPDAQGTAQQIRRKWGGYWDRCRIVSLEADPKDVDYDTLLEELYLV